MPGYTEGTYVAVIVNTLWISVCAWILAELIRRLNNPFVDNIGRIVFILGFLFPANYFRSAFSVNERTIHWVIDHPVITIPTGFLLTIFALYLLIFRLKSVTHFLSFVLLILSPFAVLTIGQAMWKIAVLKKASPGVADIVYRTTTSSPRAVKQRVIWLMFDELDLRLAFLDPPDGMKFPEFERFREQALFALNAKSLVMTSTAIAIPSYMMGKLAKKAIPTGPDTLKLQFVDGDTGYFSRRTDYQTFFGEARAIGSKTAIIGYYHPYSRIFIEDYSFCSWYAVNTYTPQATASVPTEMWSQLKGITPFFRRTNAIATYRGILRDTLKVVVDPEYDLIYVHASVPHGPNIYEEHSNTFSVLNISKRGYFSNLALADHFLGELRRAMQEANLWEQTTIFITSDHEWRFPYLYDGIRVRKVPFLLKMQSQNKQLVYEPPFYPMSVAKDLLLQVLMGQLNDPKEVLKWLTKRKVE
jgi:hypothetical protein